VTRAGLGICAISPTKDEVGPGSGADHGRVGNSEQSGNPPDAPPMSRDVILVLDAAVGASLLAAATARTVGRGLRRRVGGAVNPVAVVVLRPPMLTERYQVGTWLAGLAREGGRGRHELERQLSGTLDKLVPAMVDAVLKRIDLAGLAEGVIAEVDLAEIIRQSTGSVASDTVRGVRMQGISGDEAVGRVVGRLRLRLGRKGTPASPPAEPSAGADAFPAAGSDVPQSAPEPELTPSQP